MKKLSIALVVAAVLAGCGENTPVQTVDWYKAHDTERKEMIAKCKSNPGEVGATLSGSVVKVLVTKGQAVTKGMPLIVTEAMKMETTIAAPMSGIVADILVSTGSRIESGDCLLEIENKN